MSAREKRARAKERRRREEERRRQLEQQRERSARRRRLVGITSGALAVLLVATVVGVVVQRQRAGTDGPAPRGVVAGGTAIAVGKRSAPVTLTVYADYRCPACKSFEQRYGETIEELIGDGTLRVEQHIATIIDAIGSSGSKVAGNAAACAQDAGEFRRYHARLFANQPREDVDGFTEDRVLQLAKRIPGLDSPSFRACVEDQRYRPWLERVQADFDERFDQTVTPSVLLDGKLVLGGGRDAPAAEITPPRALERTVRDKAADTAGS